MVEVAIYVPVTDNEQREFTDSHHAQFEWALVELFDAFSRLPGVVQGQWAHEGRLYEDKLRVYIVSVDGLLEQADTLLLAIAIARDHYAQLAIHVSYLGQSENL